MDSGLRTVRKQKQTVLVSEAQSVQEIVISSSSTSNFPYRSLT